MTIPTLVKDYSSLFAFGAGGGSNLTLDPNFQGSPLVGETVGNFASGNTNPGNKGFGGPFPFGTAQHTRSR